MRRLALALVTLACATSRASAQPLTARQVIDRIKANAGVPWTGATVDTVKAGDLDTPVTGVAVTMMATLDVLQRAAAAGQNLVITHEPTFYDHLDPTAGLVREGDAVTAAKLRFTAEHHMVVWRFHDYAHRMKPDIVVKGVVRALGWTAYQDREQAWLLHLPPLTLAELAAQVRERLGAHALRVVGDPALRVTDVALAPGAAGFPLHRMGLRANVQALVIGEAREWETVEYVDDAVAAGMPRGLIIIGHIPSEQPGMEDATAWIRGFVPEVPVAFVSARDPFWPSNLSPAASRRP